ncbi:MAG TPA: RNA 2',3'-cyclic phosphodiesterase [Propionicimonas sp.]|nr:RNA 2',3'-cyclic phosphodiesterase [Propionicimonas sp.]HQA78617.1 RNA 2',3'-cyclic phosphodiesterase [Propionicimonas sp.]HQD97370.1 RNA 2',3'-cyclic phosphodiesterase [Propionicimonas sp.]
MAERLFVAVLPSASVREALDTFLEPRRTNALNLRWTLPESWHLTCAFMADVHPSAVPDLEAALAEVAARTRPFAVTIEGAGAFPDPDHARAFWLGVSAGGTELAQLAKRSRTAVTRSGVEVEGGRLRPHLTIARANGISGTGWLEVFNTIPAQTWAVERFSLIRSQSLPGGAGYQSLAEFDLAN